MTRQEILNIIVNTLKEDYDIDISELPPETPVSDIRKMSDKLDSLEFLQFIFSVEDKIGAELPENRTNFDNIGEILDAFCESANAP